MKKYLLSLLCVATMVACAPKNRIIENPLIDVTNTTTVDITRVEMTDSTTVLNVEAYFHPKKWIKFVKETYLQVGEQKFQILSAEGLELDKKFWMPESGRASFVMTFPAIPRDAKSFDFIEGDCDNCYKLYGIDLTGKKSYAKYHPDLPQEFRKKIKTTNELPRPEYKFGKTTINIHLLGYRKGYAKKLEGYITPLLGDLKQICFNIDQETGVATYEAMLYGGTILSLNFPGDVREINYCYITLGEVNDIYIDLRATGYEIVARRNGEKSSLPLTYTKGQYAELNNAIDNVDLYNYFNLFGEFAKGVTSAEGYIERTKEKYQTLTDSIANLNKSLLLKKYMQLVVDTELLTAATLATTIIYYTNETNKSIKLSDEQVQHLLEPIDLNDDKLLLAHWNLQYYLIGQIGNDNIYAEYGKGKLDFKSADKEYTINNYLNKKPQKYLSKNKFFNQAFDAKVAEMAKIMLDSKVKIEPTPDVADDKMLEAIIAPHKGKVVLVDFWNTWCGPCLQMHKIVAELREANKDLEEVVWIYIANDSSPLPTYKQMIPEIKGLHYRLADKHAGAWTAIGKQLNITGIPSYVLVEKDGSYKLRDDLRGGEEMVSVLRNSLKK